MVLDWNWNFDTRTNNFIFFFVSYGYFTFFLVSYVWGICSVSDISVGEVDITHCS